MTHRRTDRISDRSRAELVQQFAGEGLVVDYGACIVRVRACVPEFVDVFHRLYGGYEYIPESDFADFHVRVDLGQGLRRWLRPQSRFTVDGVGPFEPFSRPNALPLYEWGVNWCFGQRFNQYVLLHAGVLAAEDRAVVMPAVPGSGKSTLTAAMMLDGFRLLSDEFGVLQPDTGELLPMLKPVALKNRSIDVIRRFSPDAHFGPTFAGTRKGDVAHLAPDHGSVAAADRSARPALVIFPAYREGAQLDVVPQPPEQAFARLAFNSFNYAMLGAVSFEAVADLAGRCPAYQVTYGRLDEAITCIRELVHDDGRRGA